MTGNSWEIHQELAAIVASVSDVVPLQTDDQDNLKYWVCEYLAWEIRRIPKGENDRVF